MSIKAVPRVLLSVALIVFVLLCIMYQNVISIAVYKSMERAVTRIIPSLFAMTVICGLIQKCEVFSWLLTKTKLDAIPFSLFILGNLGGYPIGAKLISECILKGDVDKSKAAKMLTFSFGCGPSFAIGVSYAIYGNSIFGFISFASIFISNLILFIIYSLTNHNTNKSIGTRNCFSTSLVVECVSNAADSMILITAMIAAFSVIVSLLECLFPSLFTILSPALLEISNVTELVRPSLMLTTALLAFGGVCVHMQVLALINDTFSVKLFYLSRLIQIPLSSGISSLICRSFSISEKASTRIVRLSESNSIIPLICMLAMLIIVFLHKKSAQHKPCAL